MERGGGRGGVRERKENEKEIRNVRVKKLARDRVIIWVGEGRRQCLFAGLPSKPPRTLNTEGGGRIMRFLESGKLKILY